MATHDLAPRVQELLDYLESSDDPMARFSKLPIAKDSVAKTLKILDNPNSNFDRIVEQLSPSVAALFLDMANTMGAQREVVTLNHAVKLLGYGHMQEILKTSFIFDHFVTQSDFGRFSFHKFNLQAHFCGAVASLLGELVDYEHPEELVTVGILHNIGKIVIACHLPEDHANIVELKKNTGMPSHEAEESVLGMNHAEIGAMMLSKLHIPQPICDAIRYHDSNTVLPEQVQHTRLILIAREASEIVGCFLLPESGAILDLKNKIKTRIDFKGLEDDMRRLQKDSLTLRREEYFANAMHIARQYICGAMQRVFRQRTAADPSFA